MEDLKRLLRQVKQVNPYLPLSVSVTLQNDLRAIQTWGEHKCAEIEHLKREKFGLKQSVKNKAETLEKLGGYHNGNYGKGKVKR